MIAAPTARPTSLDAVPGTRADRSHTRAGGGGRLIAAAAAWKVVGRGVSMVGALALTPLVLHHLGSNAYGTYVTIVTTATMLAVADLGIGAGLISRVAAAETAVAGSSRPIVLAAYRKVLLIALIGATVSLVLGAFGVWPAILGLQSRGPGGDDAACVVATVLFFLTLPQSVSVSALAGLQQSSRAAKNLFLGNVVQIVGLLIGLRLGLGLAGLMACYFGSNLVVAAAQGMQVYRWSAQRSPGTDGVAGRGSGGAYLVIVLAGLVAYYSDILVISHVRGESAVTQYSISFRLFMLLPTLVGLALEPLWPAYAARLASGEFGRVRRMFVGSLGSAFGVNLLWGTVLLFTGPDLIRAWVGGAVSSPPGLRWALVCYVGVNGITGPVSMLLNGADLMRTQARLTCAMAGVNLPLSIWLTHLCGAAGPIWGTVIAQGLIVDVPAIVIVGRLLRPQPDGSART